MGFITGRVGQGKSFAVIGQLEDDDGKEIEAWQVGFWREGSWQADQVIYFAPVAVTPLFAGPDMWFILGAGGECLWVDVTAQGITTLREGTIGQGELPMFTNAYAFDNGVVAIGMDRKVWFTVDGQWEPMGANLPSSNPKDMIGLEAAASRGPELAVCGWAGEVWILSAGQWHDAKVPVQSILSGITAGVDGNWVVCGRDGVLFRRVGTQWENLCLEPVSDDFWSMTTFQNHLYVSSMQTLYQYESGQNIDLFAFVPINLVPGHSETISVLIWYFPRDSTNFIAFALFSGSLIIKANDCEFLLIKSNSFLYSF